MDSPSEIDASEIDRLWSAFKESGDNQDRDALIIWYSPLVKFVAGRLMANLPSSVEQADVLSYGIFGLIEAIERFEPPRGIRFENYAMSRIRGAMFDELRRVDWVPRALRHKMRLIHGAISALESTLHRSPADNELAAELEWTEAQLNTALTEISHVRMAALDDSGSLADMIVEGQPTAMSPFELAETRQVLASEVAHLPEREKTVLALYYYEGMTLLEIGRVLDVSESRASQIHTKALLHLRARLGDSP